MATTLRITHHTEYRYERPVFFGPHRLMIRPRDGHDLRLLDSALTITPHARMHWAFDSFGNSVAWASFDEPSAALAIHSDLLIRRYPSGAAMLPDTSACSMPVRYDSDERIDLAPMMVLQFPEDRPRIEAWLDDVFTSRPRHAFDFLSALSDVIHHRITYSQRDELGTHPPATTIDLARGTCRDIALLFIESCRLFGIAARFVTGYLHSPAGANSLGGGATHAWADVYVPGRGWVEFDPTNRLVAGADLIRVATTRTPAQASPVSGTWRGDGALFSAMTVDVQVVEAPQDVLVDKL